jgi:hypothetical protein
MMPYQLTTSKNESLYSFALQSLFALAVSGSCFGMSIQLVAPVGPFCRRIIERYSPPEYTLACITHIASIHGQLAPWVADLTAKVFGDLSPFNAVHLYGAIFEALAIVLCLFAPRGPAKYGQLSFAVMPPLFILMCIIGLELCRQKWTEATVWNFSFASTQSLFICASCFLRACMARCQCLPVTASFDFTMFWLLLIIFYTALSYYTIQYGTWARIGW